MQSARRLCKSNADRGDQELLALGYTDRHLVGFYSGGIPALTIRQLIEFQAARTPDAIALLAPGREAMAYARLGVQVEQTRRELHAAGLRAGDRIAVVLPNGPEMAAAFLATASVGTCAPLNPAYRESEYQFYLSDLAPKAMIVEEGAASPAASVARALGIPVIQLHAELDQPAGTFHLTHDSLQVSDADLREPQPDDIALVLHTSGTTSRPKQVPLSNANLCRSAANIRGTLGLTPADRCLNVMSLFHIHGLAAALTASLSAGASLVCTPGFFAPQFADWLSEFEPTWYTAVPTMHQAILARLGEAPRASSLRLIRSSSAPLAAQVMAGLERMFSVPVVEAYGMTEAAHQMASNPLPPGRRKPGSVGMAAGPEVAVFVEGKPAAQGTVGEIVIRGANVMQGYAGNDDANREAFVSGWFRTGDLGWMDEENYLFISGRAKEIINRGGEKISPREIDETLLDHPAIAQALAFAIPHPKLGEEPAAAVVLKPGVSATESELREFVSVRLADFKVPRRILALDEIPKGPTGKPQRIGMARALGLDQPVEPAAAVSSEWRPPRSPSEKLLADLWREALGRDDFGIGDSFFDLGGDSMLATRLLARVAQAAGAAPSLLRFFDGPTIETLAAHLDPDAVFVPESPPKSNPDAAAALSFAQQRFWFLDQYEEDKSAYVQTSAIRLRGALDEARLRHALDRVIARHEVLRTTYSSEDGAPKAVVGKPRGAEWKRVAIGRIEELNTLAAAEAHVPFDLTRDLPLRPTLAQIGSDDHALIITRHHIASDGWSAELLWREWATIYTGATPPELAVQYGDYARWQSERYASGAFQKELAYWTGRLAGSPPWLDLPLDRPRGHRQTFRGARQRFVITPELSAALGDLARREGATLFMALLAAFYALLERYTGARDIAVGVPVAGRVRAELEPLLGPLMNTLAMRADVPGNGSFLQLLAHVREVSIGALAHQELPFEKLMEALHPVRSMSQSPIFQTMFQFRNLPFATPRFADLDAEPLELDHGIAPLDLSLEIAPAAGGLEGTLIYNSDLFHPETAARLATHYSNLMAAAVQNPECGVARLAMLGDDERRQLVHGWNQTECAIPDEPVQALFEAQAARRPNAIAVIDAAGQATYAELNGAAEELARELRELGAGPGMLVAVCLERSRAMAAAILAVLKTGAAYLPIDPRYPRERIEFMLEDSGAALVLTGDGIVPRDTAAEHSASTAYAIYTSGSTGTPKAVVVPQSALSNVLEAMRAELGVAERDVTVAVTTISFDIAAIEILLPLITGGTLAIAGHEEQTDGRLLCDLMERVNATWMQATPSTWKLLMEAGWGPRNGFTAVCGGETMPRPLANALAAKCARVFNVYGPTETTIWSSMERVTPGEGAVCIGRPLANTQLYILDEVHEPVPLGVSGELFIGGAGVAEGYWKRGDLTAERFVPDPFSRDAHARMYQTGDMARRLPDGRVDFLGRSDGQAKLRGFRIELGEVEAALATHPEVLAAAAAIRGQSLVAWCVWRSVPVESADLRPFLAARLPDYMLPGRFIGLASLPLLPNGKIDRGALLDLEEPPAKPRMAGAPASETERRIAAIWQELIGPAGIEDNFFDLGGHSLLAARAVALIGHEIGVPLAVAALFENPTIRAFAEHIDRGAPARWPPRIRPIQPAGLRVPLWAIGGGANFHALAQHLDRDQPLLGIQFEEAEAADLEARDLAAITREIVRSMRRQQPYGPYQLIGHSLYGLYAYEAARQLAAAGEQVRFLALVDTFLPVAIRLRFPLRTRARIQAAAAWWLMSRGRFFDAGQYVFSAAKDIATRTLRSLPAQPAERSIEDLLRQSASGYQPRPYSGRMIYLQAADQPIPLHLGSRIGWQELAAGGFELRIVPGDHNRLLERTQVAAIAAVLSDFLAVDTRAPARADSSSAAAAGA